MPHTNRLLPVLEVIDPITLWPADLSDTSITLLGLTAVEHLRAAREVADWREEKAAGEKAEPHLSAEVRMMDWTIPAAVTARSVINLSGMSADDRDDTLLRAVAAALVARAATLSVGPAADRDPVHNLHQRAIGAARWVRAGHTSGVPQLRDFVDVLHQALPPGFDPGGHLAPRQTGDDTNGQVYSFWRRRPDGVTDSIRLSTEFGGITEASYSRRAAEGAPASEPQKLSFGELCALLARAHAVEAD